MKRLATISLAFVFLAFLLIDPIRADGEWSPRIDEKSTSELFEISEELEVIGPSQFPKPTSLLNDPNVVVIVEPTFGKHRPDQDVVMAYAEGYTLPYYMSVSYTHLTLPTKA